MLLIITAGHGCKLSYWMYGCGCIIVAHSLNLRPLLTHCIECQWAVNAYVVDVCNAYRAMCLYCMLFLLQYASGRLYHNVESCMKDIITYFFCIKDLAV